MSIVQYELLIYGFGVGCLLCSLLFITAAVFTHWRSHRRMHPDDVAVEVFAARMKTKLRKKREEGYGGWNKPEECHATFLREQLRNHLHKGDPVDVANYAMMLWHRGESTAVPEE